MPIKSVKMKISKNKKNVFFLMSQGSLAQILHSWVKNCDRQLEAQTLLVLYKEKIAFLSHVPRITQPKKQVPGSKGMLCSPRTDTLTHTRESEYRGHPFRVSGFFLQTIIKDWSNNYLSQTCSYSDTSHLHWFDELCMRMLL